MPKNALVPAPTRCVFCARTFSKRHGRDRSGEHIIPQWSHALYERPAGELLHHRIGTAQQNDGKAVLVIPRLYKRAGDFASRVVKVVCSDCNSSWMNQMEEEVRGPLTCLIKGEELTLGPEQQLAISKWIAMKAMLAEHTSPSDLVIPRIELHRFYAERTLNPSWRIAIGPREAQDPWYFHRSWSVGESREKADEAGQNVQRTFLGIGKLIIEAIYCSYSGGMFAAAPEGFVQTFPTAEPFPVIPISPRIEDLRLNDMAFGAHPPLANLKRLSERIITTADT